MTDDLARYHRQMLLPGFGEAGQRRLGNSTVLLLGCGALGSVAAEMLARAGVGHLVIADRDFVELTNLQRQVLFDEDDAAASMPKAAAAKSKLALINSAVEVTAIVDDVNHSNIARFAAGADVLVDGLDNLEARYLANDYAVQTGTPFIYGAAVGTVGMAFAVLPRSAGAAAWEAADGGGATPCFRCLFENAPPPGTTASCETAGVVGSATGIVANFQVTQALKILTGNFAQVSRTLLNIDLWSNEVLQLDVTVNRDCSCCGQRRFDFLGRIEFDDALRPQCRAAAAPPAGGRRGSRRRRSAARHCHGRGRERIHAARTDKRRRSVIRGDVVPGWARNHQGYRRHRGSPEYLR